MAINLGGPTTPTHNQLSPTAADASRSGDEIFGGEELLELGILDTVGILGGGGSGGDGESVGSGESHHSVVSLDLTHATHSRGQRVGGGGRSRVGNSDIFDAWPRT